MNDHELAEMVWEGEGGALRRDEPTACASTFMRGTQVEAIVDSTEKGGVPRTSGHHSSTEGL